MKNIIYKKAETTQELDQILELQRLNIKGSISKEEGKSEGFVTVQHDFELLKTMNNKCAHTIAKSNDKVVGYALSMVKEFKEEIAILKPMFKEIEKTIDSNLSYIAMG